MMQAFLVAKRVESAIPEACVGCDKATEVCLTLAEKAIRQVTAMNPEDRLAQQEDAIASAQIAVDAIITAHCNGQFQRALGWTQTETVCSYE